MSEQWLAAHPTLLLRSLILQSLPERLCQYHRPQCDDSRYSDKLPGCPLGDGAATFSPYGFALPNNKSRNINHHLVQKTSINLLITYLKIVFFQM
jgi:hypothetical protein